jgi:hypothetical protein
LGNFIYTDVFGADLNLPVVLRHALNLTQQLVCAKRFSMLEAEKLITRVS